MQIQVTGAPCCWGVDDPKNPYLPPWKQVLSEAAQAGYRGLELGPYGYIPIDIEQVGHELQKNDLSIIAGTIFDDLLTESYYPELIKQVHDICSLITALPVDMQDSKQHFPAPYLVLIDWGHDERDYAAGHPDRAPRLSKDDWAQIMRHVRELAKLSYGEYGVRSVIHPHAGGYIEFDDEIQMMLDDISYETVGLCLDTGHLYYSKMDPLKWISDCKDWIDYLHFKDIDPMIYKEVMEEHIRFFEACAKGVMCPIGKGIIDYPAILSLLKRMDYHGYITIEQERDPRHAGSSLEDVKQSLDYLKKTGF